MGSFFFDGFRGFDFEWEGKCGCVAGRFLLVLLDCEGWKVSVIHPTLQSVFR